MQRCYMYDDPRSDMALKYLVQYDCVNYPNNRKLDLLW